MCLIVLSIKTNLFFRLQNINLICRSGKFNTTDAAIKYLEELVDSVTQEDIPGTLLIEMPDAGELSGEDDAEEDDGGTLDDLPRGILLQPCEIRLENVEEDIEELPDLNSYGDITEVISNATGLINVSLLENAEIPLTPPAKRRKSSRHEPLLVQPKICTEPETSSMNIPSSLPHLADKFKWTTKKNLSTKPLFPAPDYRDCTLPAWDMFEKFFDEAMFKMIVENSNEYGIMQTNNNPEITTNELRVFIGIMLITGYSQVGDTKSYWCMDGDLHNQMIASAMTRDRFSTISKFIHFASPNAVDLEDKMWKLRPLTNNLIKNCIKNFHPEQDLSYDESMIAYYGRHGCKQFIRGKPVRFGYKVWCLNTPQGYLINFEVYQGKNPRVNSVLESKFGKCVAPLLQMIHEMPSAMKTLPYCFYFDNLFTSIPVLAYLKHLGYDASGTIRERRIPRNCPLPKNDKIKKMARGTFYTKTISNLDISVTKWMDNSVVCAASTIFEANPIGNCKRYSRETHQRINVPRPHVLKEYNQNMGGTDRMDQNISYFRISTRKKKWWWSIFTYCIDVAVQNAWLLQRKGGSNITQKQFRREIAKHYCTKFADLTRIQKGKKKYKVLDSDVRFDGICHYVSPSPTRRRCAGQFCKSTTRLICKKCDVGLCPPCFESYHTISEYNV